MISYARAILICIVFAVNIHISLQCPQGPQYLKSMYKSGELPDQDMPITIQNLKDKLKQSGIFDYEDKSLSERERKELAKLFNLIEIMTTSRSRQPSNVQTIFSSMRLLERAVKKQLKENQISESLASKFHWEKLFNAHRRVRTYPTYYLDKSTNMRVFNTDLSHLDDFLSHRAYN